MADSDVFGSSDLVSVRMAYRTAPTTGRDVVLPPSYLGLLLVTEKPGGYERKLWTVLLLGKGKGPREHRTLVNPLIEGFPSCDDQFLVDLEKVDHTRLSLTNLLRPTEFNKDPVPPYRVPLFLDLTGHIGPLRSEGVLSGSWTTEVTPVPLGFSPRGTHGDTVWRGKVWVLTAPLSTVGPEYGCGVETPFEALIVLS